MGLLSELKAERPACVKTIVLSMCFLAGGMSSAIVGPTLLDLQTQTSTTLDHVSLVLTSRAMGMGAGALLAGIAYPKCNFLLSTSISSLVAAVSTTLIGHLHSIDWMLVVFAVSGMSLGLIEGGSIVFVFHMWGSVAMPIIQTAYFMFGIGALAAPLLSQPFLLVTHPGDLMDGLEIGYRAAKSHEHLHDQGMECNLVVPYSVLAGLMLVNAVLMFLVWCWSPETPEHPSRIQVPKEGSVVGMQEKTRSTVWKAVVVMLHLLVVHLYFGVYVGLASYLSSFVVTSDLNLSKTEGAHMTTMFWSTFTFAKLVALAYTPWIGNRNSVLLGLSVMLTGSILLVLFAETSESLVWLAVALIGIGLSSIYACMLRYLENFFPVTSTIGSLTSVAGVLGEFTFPALISLFIDSTPIVVVWVVAASSVAMSALFPLIILLCNTKLKA